MWEVASPRDVEDGAPATAEQPVCSLSQPAPDLRVQPTPLPRLHRDMAGESVEQQLYDASGIGQRGSTGPLGGRSQIMSAWGAETPGVVLLPSGRLVRGRALKRPLSEGAVPEFAIYLLRKRPDPVSWESRWLRWPDFWLPADHHDAQNALREAWSRSIEERVEIACTGGHGRTGTALACLAVLDGLPAREAVAYVRKHYDPRAVETPCSGGTSPVSPRHRQRADERSPCGQPIRAGERSGCGYCSSAMRLARLRLSAGWRRRRLMARFRARRAPGARSVAMRVIRSVSETTFWATGRRRFW